MSYITFHCISLHLINLVSITGLGFKVDEIVQAWNEMFDAKRWRSDVPSFRLEPILRRRVPKFHRILENM